MKWLLWKEYRQNRLAVFTLLLLLIVPYLIALCTMWWYRGTETLEEKMPRWVLCLALASGYALCLSQFVLGLLGGNAIAGERADRSAEFQVCLPLTRTRILSAKLLFVLVIAAGIWLINPLVLCILATATNATFTVSALLPIAAVIAATGLTFFCVSWLCSSIIANPLFCVITGLVAPLFVGGSILAVLGLLIVYGPDTILRHLVPHEVLYHWYLGICLTLSAVCFTTGTWLYLRRVEP